MNASAGNVASFELRASLQDGSYPRPQLMRGAWAELGGEWEFRYDDEDLGRRERWFDGGEFDRTIIVPFPPESPASGIADTGFHRVAWYRRALSAADLARAGFGQLGSGSEFSADASRGGDDGIGAAGAAGAGVPAGASPPVPGGSTRLVLHFGAVDYRAEVWLNGVHLGSHEGGHTPFSFDVTDVLRTANDGGAPPQDAPEQVLVVRAEDDPADAAQPRGKQDWRLEPHSVWYHRTTGIWQPVWLEAVPEVAFEQVHWVAEASSRSVEAQLRLNVTPPAGAWAAIELSVDGRAIGAARVPAVRRDVDLVVPMPEQANGQAYEELLWSPESPRLIDATVRLELPDSSGDVVASYFGLRSAAVAGGRFILNDRPCFVRSVLNQGYWPESHLASPSAAALRREVELIKEMGFNATRVHQKIEDPRFLFWADRLGLLVWGETPSAFEFSRLAVARMTTEWIAAIERDRSHPSIVTWVPINESWGVQHIGSDAEMRAYARSLVQLTKALDGTRPVVSNDGWEHVDSDIISVHDYEWSGDVMRARYLDGDAKAALLGGIGPAGRPILLDGQAVGERPVMLTEFGGVSFEADAEPQENAWGYSSAVSADDFRARVDTLFGAIAESTFLAGFCYTQLTDTLQETNGLLTADRQPKFPMADIRAAVAGPR